MTEYEEAELKNWAPVVGRWRIDDETITYEGPQAKTDVPFGICVSDARVSEGFISATVQLSKDSEDNISSGRILLGYRSSRDRYFSVGLVGYRRAYVLSEFSPDFGWRGNVVEGDERNLQEDKPYRIETKVVGQRIYLSVNNVRVFEHVLDRPLQFGQAGLYTWGHSKVIFSNVTARYLKPKIFVVMQFSEPYQQLYKEVIQPIANRFGFQAYHVGEVYGPGMILNDIVQGLIDAKIVIAEITPANQNVFYELGFAHALRKPTILLAERGKQLPFDITGYRCLFYDNTIGGKRQVEEALIKHLEAITHI